jgi:glycosyltransferase involved in cell wall biosynthesis
LGVGSRGKLTVPRARRDPDAPISVVHFISNSHPSGYFPLIARHTDHRRFRMEVGSLDDVGGLQERLREVGVSTFALDSESRWRWPLATLRLAARLRRERIDVLHTHLIEASLVGLVAAKLARTRLAVFTGHHSHEVPLHNKRVLFEVDRLAARWLADVVISPSGEMRDTFVNVYGCCPDRVEVIEHGIDLSRFDPEAIDGADVRTELGLDGKVVFGAISKHFWVKNLDALVRAFAVIAERNPDTHLVVVGIGDRAPLASLVDTMGLSGQVSVLAPRRDIQQLLAAFDVFVHPALAESFGLAVIEAMAMRRPVVATPVGIAGDVIEDGVSGVRIGGTDVDSLVEAMSRALEWRERWPELGAEARRRALTFTPERWVNAHERLYQRRLGLRPYGEEPAEST